MMKGIGHFVFMVRRFLNNEQGMLKENDEGNWTFRFLMEAFLNNEQGMLNENDERNGAFRFYGETLFE